MMMRNRDEMADNLKLAIACCSRMYGGVLAMADVGARNRERSSIDVIHQLHDQLLLETEEDGD